MDSIFGGAVSRAADLARRVAEEATRRLAAEAARQAAAEAQREAARRRLLELNQGDGYETRPAAGAFSPATAPIQTPTPTTTSYSLDEAARLAAAYDPPEPVTPLQPPSPGAVPRNDEAELALLAYRMGEHGASPEQIQEAVARTRLTQIDRAQQVLAPVDGVALEEQGELLVAGAQAAVDHYVSSLDSIYSGLAPVDREQAGHLAYLQHAQAAGLVYEGVAVQTQAAGLELERAALERQLAVTAGATPAELAEIDARIVAARMALDGNPASAGEIEELERQLDMLHKSAELYDPNRPADWRAGYERQLAALQSQVDALQLQLPENSLLTRLGEAQSAYEASALRLAGQEAELVAALAEYQAGIAAVVPRALADIEEFRQNVDLAAASPELDQAVRDLEAILPTATPEQLQLALDRIEALPSGDIVLHRLQGGLNPLGSDPRLLVLSGRQIGVPQGLERLAQELILNTALLGIPSFIENQRIVNAPGASPGLVAQAQLGLALDYVGFALTIAGPVVDGVTTLARGGRTVVELTPEMRDALRAAGYADDAIEPLLLRLNQAATSSNALSNLMLRSSPEDAAELLGLMRQTLPLETHALRTVPGYPNPVRQLVHRPQEVVDFIVRSDAATVEAFHALVNQGRSLDEARTILTLARNGRSVDEVTAALAAGRTLDELAAETFFVRVSAQQAHEFSGIPRTFLTGGSIEDIAALARESGADILVRDANQGLEATMAARWPKDPHANFTVGGTPGIKVTSDPQLTAELGYVRFKTDGSTRVGLEVRDASGGWVPQDSFVVHGPEGWRLVGGAELDTMPEGWWSMGGDIDLLAVIEPAAGGYRLQPAYSETAEALLDQLNGIATVPAGLPGDEVPGLFMHGSNLPFFNTNRGWTPALVFTSEGEMIRLAGDDAVEYWFRMRGVPSEPYAHYSELVSWLAARPVPLSSAAYLAGTVVGNLPEVLNALPDVPASTVPTGTPGPTSTGDAPATPPPVPVPVAPTATPTPTPTPTAP
jgi:hypothetical protein